MTPRNCFSDSPKAQSSYMSAAGTSKCLTFLLEIGLKCSTEWIDVFATITKFTRWYKVIVVFTACYFLDSAGFSYTWQSWNLLENCNLAVIKPRQLRDLVWVVAGAEIYYFQSYDLMDTNITVKSVSVYVTSQYRITLTGILLTFSTVCMFPLSKINFAGFL